RFTEEGAEDHGDGDVVVRAVHDLHRITGADLTGLDDPQVGTGYGGAGELLDPALAPPPALERAARGTRAGHLQHGAAAHAPAFADARAVDVAPDGGEVLAEDAVGQLPAHRLLPAVQVLAGVGVDGLVVPAVVLHVEHAVAREPDRAGPLGTGRGDGDGPLDGPLVDASRLDPLPGIGPWPADVHGQQLHGRRRYG